MNKRAIGTDGYRQAVEEIIRQIRRASGLSDSALADRIGCSASTVRNARNGQTSLDPALLLRIEQEFGPGALDPFLALANSRAVPLPQANALGNPALAIVAALHRIIDVQAASSEGGQRITRRELQAILADLRRGRAALDQLIAKAGDA
ncbi:MAG: helix-turn-helix transcriptional regulator [Pseudomonadota bacterium]